MKPNLATLLLCLSLCSLHSKAQTGTTPSLSDHKKTNLMKTYSLLVRVPLTYTTAQAKAVGPLWDQTLARWKAEGVYVISFAFPGESYIVAGAAKNIRKETVVAENRRVVSNIVLRAPTVEAALELAKACPVLEYDGTVEVREIPQGLAVQEK